MYIITGKKFGGAVMLLSCSAKKVTKERGIGEALRLGAPARRAALPYVPHPARSIDTSGGSYRVRLGRLRIITKADCSTTSALPKISDVAVQLPFGQKVGTLFVRIGFWLRCSRAIENARQGFPKGAALVREQPASAPLWSLSFGPFLGEAVCQVKCNT